MADVKRKKNLVKNVFTNHIFNKHIDNENFDNLL